MPRPMHIDTPSLFDFDFSQPEPVQPLQAGDIVKQAGCGVGKLHIVFPYWQLLGPHPDSTPLDPFWLCRAVPVSEYAGEVAVFRPQDVYPTGVRWRVPTHAEVEQWLRDEWGLNTFTACLDLQPDGTHFDYRSHWEHRGALGVIERLHPTIPHGLYIRLPPLSAEAELLALMQHLPYRCGESFR